MNGLLTERGVLDLDPPVNDLMSSDVLPEISAEATVEEARRRLRTLGVGALLDDGPPMGIVTRFDVIG